MEDANLASTLYLEVVPSNWDLGQIIRVLKYVFFEDVFYSNRMITLCVLL